MQYVDERKPLRNRFVSSSFISCVGRDFKYFVVISVSGKEGREEVASMGGWDGMGEVDGRGDRHL